MIVRFHQRIKCKYDQLQGKVFIIIRKNYNGITHNIAGIKSLLFDFLTKFVFVTLQKLINILISLQILTPPSNSFALLTTFISFHDILYNQINKLYQKLIFEILSLFQ